MTSANTLPSSEPTSPRPTNVVDFAAYAATRRAGPTATVIKDVRTAEAEFAGLQLSSQHTDTEMLIEAMRALAIARARLDRLSREAAECRRKLDSIKLG